MKVYKISIDSNNTIALTCDNPKYFTENHWHDFEGKSIKSDWSLRELYKINPKQNPLDFWVYTNGALIFLEQIKDIIDSTLSPFGEYLDIILERGPKLFLFNITSVMDCINIEESIYKVYPKSRFDKLQFLKGKECLSTYDNEKCFFWQPVFDEDKITSNVFFVMDHRGYGHGPYCTDGFFEPEEEFYHVYNNYNLTGLLFEEITLSKMNN